MLRKHILFARARAKIIMKNRNLFNRLVHTRLAHTHRTATHVSLSRCTKYAYMEVGRNFNPNGFLFYFHNDLKNAYFTRCSSDRWCYYYHFYAYHVSFALSTKTKIAKRQLSTQFLIWRIHDSYSFFKFISMCACACWPRLVQFASNKNSFCLHMCVRVCTKNE